MNKQMCIRINGLFMYNMFPPITMCWMCSPDESRLLDLRMLFYHAIIISQSGMFSQHFGLTMEIMRVRLCGPKC